jgi:hypothetical protein
LSFRFLKFFGREGVKQGRLASGFDYALDAGESAFREHFCRLVQQAAGLQVRGGGMLHLVSQILQAKLEKERLGKLIEQETRNSIHYD